MGLPLLSLPESNISSCPKALPMTLSAVPHAARQGSQKDTETGAMVAVVYVKCLGQHVPIVAKILKYPLNLMQVAGQCGVVIAIMRAD